jgi:hypothetical protein
MIKNEKLYQISTKVPGSYSLPIFSIALLKEYNLTKDVRLKTEWNKRHIPEIKKQLPSGPYIPVMQYNIYRKSYPLMR